MPFLNEKDIHWCNKCNGKMKQLFSSFYCPACEGDKIVSPPANLTINGNDVDWGAYYDEITQITPLGDLEPPETW